MNSQFRNLIAFLPVYLLISVPFLSNGYASGIIDPSTQWHLQMVGAEAAWNYTQGSSDIVVAIIDSGVDIDHPDLINQTWTNPGELPNNGIDDDANGYVDDVNGWDFRDNDNNPRPGHPHGTKVAGIMAADDDNHVSVGIAPQTSIMAIRFLDDNNGFYSWDWDIFINAIDYAINNGADIIHLSIQAYDVPPFSFHEAILRAYETGIVIVGVVGNVFSKFDLTCNCLVQWTHVTYPGNYSEVIAVTAVESNKNIASFSTTGSQTEISAPGSEVYTIQPQSSNLSLGSGTSFAAPLVSGAIALMLSLNRTLSIETIRNILHKSSVDLGKAGKDPIYGYGLLNASAALNMVIQEHNGTIPIPLNSTRPSTSFTGSLATDLQTYAVIIGIFYMVTIVRRRRKKG